MHLKETTQDEDGYIVVAVVVLMLIVLGMMGIATYRLSRGECIAVANKVERTQARYSLIGGAEFALAAYQSGDFEEGPLPFPIGAVQVTVDTAAPTASEMTTYGCNRKLIVRISGGAANDQVVVYFQGVSSTFANSAVYISGSNTITVSGGQTITNTSPIPEVDTATLKLLANNQSQYNSGPLPISSNYGSNFYISGSTPSVTWVEGDLTVGANRTAFGIFGVEGNVTLNARARINGVIYMVTAGSSVTFNDRARVTGGIVGNCNISKSATATSTSITYDNGFMTVFDGYRIGETLEMVTNESRVFW